MHNPESVLENEMHKLLGFWDMNDSPNLSQMTRSYNNQQQKKRTCRIVDFTLPADHRVKLKECEKKNKYLNLIRELKKLWNMKVTIIPIVNGALGTVTKELVLWLEDLEITGQVETIQTIALFRLEYWKESWRLEETCCYSNSSEKPSDNSGVKNS